jgi:transposase-like protein
MYAGYLEHCARRQEVQSDHWMLCSCTQRLPHQDRVKALHLLEVPMECKKCGSTNTVKNGRTATGQQQYHCRACSVYTVTGG